MTRSAAFERAADFVQRPDVEGGPSHRPSDRGGETLYGISRRAHPDVDFATLTPAGAREIYYVDYWQPLRADSLPPALAHFTFDWALNSGVSPAAKALQRALYPHYRGRIDAILGPATQQAARESDPLVVLDDLLEQRLAARFRQVLLDPSQQEFLRGWCARIAKLSLACGMLLP